MPPKIITIRRRETPIPTPVVPIDPLEKIFLAQGLNESQVKELLTLTLPSGEKLLSSAYPNTTIEVINHLKKLPFPEVIAYLKTVTTRKGLGQNSPLLEKERDQVQIDLDNLQTQIEIEEGVECIKCGKNRTLGNQRQVRSADEPMSTFYRCFDCGKQWRVD